MGMYYLFLKENGNFLKDHANPGASMILPSLNASCSRCPDEISRHKQKRGHCLLTAEGTPCSHSTPQPTSLCPQDRGQ